MKFIEFADKMVNFGSVRTIQISTLDKDVEESQRSGRPFVYIEGDRFSFVEHYDTLAQCQERFDSIMRALNK